MTEFKKTITTSKNGGVDEAGARVQQETQKVDTKISGDGQSITENIVWYILGIIEILIGFRFVLKLFGANPNSGFVDFVYNVTGVLTTPFDAIFGVSTATAGQVHSVFEPSILVAAAVYALIAWGIVKLLNINRPD